MKKILIFTTMCLIAITAIAHEKSDIIVSYQQIGPNSRDIITTTDMSLLANSTESKYFNERSLWTDSLKSTPEGKAKHWEIIKKACMTVNPDGSVDFDLRKGPVKTIYTYVFTSLNDGEVTMYNSYAGDLGYYTEPLDEIEWEILQDSTSNLLGYECIMAESDYHGRHWKAWFTIDIPMSFGPWKLRGLPGLILKAEANGGFSFVATGLNRSDREITDIYKKEDYFKVNRKKALADAEYYKNNKQSILKSQGIIGESYYTDEQGNKIDPPKYDGLKHSLEPDYKM